jgi:hypothetical protein
MAAGSTVPLTEQDRASRYTAVPKHAKDRVERSAVMEGGREPPPYLKVVFTTHEKELHVREVVVTCDRNATASVPRLKAAAAPLRSPYSSFRTHRAFTPTAYARQNPCVLNPVTTTR